MPPEGNRPLPADIAVRRRIASEVSRSVSVEASAGTGKTFLMTDRVMELARHFGGLDRLAVLTFGEAAAAELRRRVRARIRSMDGEGSEGELRRRLTDQLPAAYITTIHSFAASMLREYSHFADVDPAFDVSEQPLGRADLARMWEDYLFEDIERLWASSDLLGVCGGSLPGIAVKLASRPWLSGKDCLDADGMDARSSARARLAELELLVSGADPGDALAARLADFVEQAGALLSGAASIEQVRSLMDTVRLGAGSAKKWPEGSMQAAKDLVRELRIMLPSLPLTEQFERLVLPFVERIRHTRESDLSNLSFDELLTRLEAALERSKPLRTAISSRFRHFLVDEYQDTSIEQVMIFRRILEEGAGYRKGSITVVGDPKQSIYAWRQADLELYGEERRRFEQDADGTLSERISVSFRSSRAVISLVNAMGPFIFGGSTPFDCAYSDFEPGPEAPEGPKPILVLVEDAAGDGRIRPVDEIISTVSAWCADHLLRRIDGRAKAMDWAVLVKAGTHVENLLSCFSDAGIPFSATVGRTFKNRTETADLREMLSCLIHPGDAKALVHTLRSPFFGIGDPEITRAVSAGLLDRQGLSAEVRDAAPGAARAFEMLSRLREASRALPVGDFLQLLLRETEMVPVIAAMGWEAGRRLSNLGFLVEQAISGVYPSLDDLRAALDEGEREEGVREEPSPVAADGTVSVTTIHKSKGLTFENIILMPPFSDGRSGGGRDRVLFHEQARKAAVQFGESLGTPLLAALKERSSGRGLAEARRLVYVALTRPRSGLVVFARESMWDDPAAPPASFDGVLAGALRRAWESDPNLLEITRIPCSPRKRSAPSPSAMEAAPPGEWPLPDFTSMLPPDPWAAVSEQSPSFRLGSAVHRILEKIDFNDPEAWIARERPLLEAVFEDSGRAVALAERFFSMELPFDARSSSVLNREYPYLKLTPEGYRSRFVDLLAEKDGRLYALDYKTDEVSASEIPGRASWYVEKQAGYGQDLADALGREVSVWLAFLSPGKCHHIGDFRPAAR